MSAQMNRIVSKLDALTHAFDFDRNKLGEAMTACAADAILGQMRAEIDPDGQAWAALSEGYATWKAKAAPGAPISVLYGHMRDPDQLRGLFRITAREITQTYGTDELARDLAVWFQEGSETRNRPARRFYQFNEMALERLKLLLDAHFARMTR